MGKKSKKVMSLLLAIAVCMGMLPGIGAKAKSGEDYFSLGSHAPYIFGYEDGTFRPNHRMTRREVASLIYSLLREKPEVTESRFTDVSLSQWFGPAVNALAELGLLNGYGDGAFRPEKNITRAEFVKVLASCFPAAGGENPFADVSPSHWAYSHILTATSHGWINGYADGTFRPGNPITRAEAVTIVNKALNRTGEGFGENRTGKVFLDLKESHWAYLQIVEASGAVAESETDPEPQPNPTPGEKLVQVFASTGLNLRSGPGGSSDVLQILANGAVLTVLDETGKPWIHVKTRDGTAGYVHEDYIKKYVPNTNPADSISLSASRISVPQYKTLRLDGSSNPRVMLRWSSSDEGVVDISKVLSYREGEDGCFLLGKKPGTAVVTCTDAAGKTKSSCTVTVLAPEDIRFVYSGHAMETTDTPTTLHAVTDPGKSKVRFTVTRNGTTVKTGETAAYTTERQGENEVRIFSLPAAFSQAGVYEVAATAVGGRDTPVKFPLLVQRRGEGTGTTTSDERRVSDAMLELLMDFEGYSPDVYDDPLVPGNPTVGYGYVVQENTDFYDSMTRQEARALLIKTSDDTYGAAVNRFRERHQLRMSQSQFDALVSFNYNLGTGYMDNPGEYMVFQALLNAVAPPSDLSASHPYTGTVNTKASPLYEKAAGNAKILKQVSAGTSLAVIGISRNAQNKELWYQVKAGGATGWMRGGNIGFTNYSGTRDLNYTDSMTFATYLLAYHHTNICEPGLLFRRLREAKLFNHNNYEEANPDHPNSEKNTYAYPYPDCMKEYE